MWRDGREGYIRRKGIWYGRGSQLTVEIKHVLECPTHHGDAAFDEKGVSVGTDELDPAVVVLQGVRACDAEGWSTYISRRHGARGNGRVGK